MCVVATRKILVSRLALALEFPVAWQASKHLVSIEPEADAAHATGATIVIWLLRSAVVLHQPLV